MGCHATTDYTIHRVSRTQERGKGHKRRHPFAPKCFHSSLLNTPLVNVIFFFMYALFALYLTILFPTSAIWWTGLFYLWAISFCFFVFIVKHFFQDRWIPLKSVLFESPIGLWFYDIFWAHARAVDVFIVCNPTELYKILPFHFTFMAAITYCCCVFLFWYDSSCMAHGL